MLFTLYQIYVKLLKTDVRQHYKKRVQTLLCIQSAFDLGTVH